MQSRSASGDSRGRTPKVLTSPRGPVYAAVRRKAEGIEERARDNVSGRFLDVKTGRLRDGYGGNRGIHIEMSAINGEVQARVGSDAVDPISGESYPGFWNAGLRRGLTPHFATSTAYGR